MALASTPIGGNPWGIEPDKQEVALVHALEVGVAEIQARRKRQKPPS